MAADCLDEVYTLGRSVDLLLTSLITVTEMLARGAQTFCMPLYMEDGFHVCLFASSPLFYVHSAYFPYRQGLI